MANLQAELIDLIRDSIQMTILSLPWTPDGHNMEMSRPDLRCPVLLRITIVIMANEENQVKLLAKISGVDVNLVFVLSG